jgi:hypothetical protein
MRSTLVESRKHTRSVKVRCRLCPGGTLTVEMTNPRSMMASVNKYVTLAGKSCCCGRSWVGLNRSLERRADDADDCCLEDMPEQPVVDEPEKTFLSGSAQR